MRIYVASSWRNDAAYPAVVVQLRRAGHDVYDFRNPRPGDFGFHWSEIDPTWESWDAGRFRQALEDPIAVAGFASDFDAMRWAEAFVLVLPCGRSAHLEAGWAIGAGKPTAVLLADGEPELMYLLAGYLALTVAEVLSWLELQRPP